MTFSLLLAWFKHILDSFFPRNSRGTSNHWRCSVNLDVLNNFAKFREKRLC